VQESGGLPQNRIMTIAYRECSPLQTQRRLCGVTIQTSCFDSGTSPTRSVGVSEIYLYRHIRQMGECPPVRFSLSRSISIGLGNRSIFAPRKPMQNAHPCAFRFRVRSLLVQKIVRFRARKAHTARFLVEMVYHTTLREKCAVRAVWTPRTAFSASGLA
jgi:hypothetical protein